ncbi:MAG: FecR domain-containing protein [Candidatus Thiodiazotropha lotti]|nr:FecR domain-containing protein [Candidatus Thiodiazotropha lotti]MCW4206307.1 FecR domain-containing protein [Candidatus Thiodiazotropha lotti]MCW4217570.1 FecR domain-containing protein [Candidatus Thiodiazotropha lotti]
MLKRIFFLRNTFLILLFSLPVQASDWVYTVVDGDNLWDFSAKHLDSVMRYEQLRKLNNIKNPKRLQPGSWLRVPMKWIRSNAIPARVGLLEGKVRIVRADGSAENKLESGVLIHLGDTLNTGQNSSASIIFADNSSLTLYSDTEMRFDHLSAYGETGMVDSRVHLGQGRMETKVKPTAGPGSRFEIHTPSAITAVRGTAYRAAISPSGDSSSFEVLEGDVVVSGAEQDTLVSAGFGTQVALGKAPAKPRKLLPPPAMDEMPQPLRALQWQLSWQALDGAKSYRAEISSSRHFAVLQWESVVDKPLVKLPDLADGDYWFRVRGIDEIGLEGQSAVQPLLLDRHPQPPTSLSPADGEMLDVGGVELKWQQISDVRGYLLEVADDQTFENILYKKETDDKGQFEVTELKQPGRYFWRVSAIAEDGEVGPSGAIRSWRLRADMESPNVIVTAKEAHVASHWQPLNPNYRYHVQLAHDADFKQLEFDQIITANEQTFDHIYSQLRYLRVCAVDEDDYHGPWSSVHKVDPLLGKSVWIVPINTIMGLLFL